jgi:type IV pilus assembly protein PilB
MSTHPDATAFMRGYLRNPTDATARLVFADWLEETCEQSNVAWARYIRLKAQADRCPAQSAEQLRLDAKVAEFAPHIKACLTIPAALFVGYPRSLLQLLPAQNYTVKLAAFETPPAILELIPQSVAWENLLLPLDLQDNVLFIANADPHNGDTIQKLQFILNKDVIAVRAEEADLRAGLVRHFGEWDVRYVDTCLPEFADYDRNRSGGQVSDALVMALEAPVDRLMNPIFDEAIDLRAESVQITLTPEAITVRYLIGNQWVERDSLPGRLGHALVLRIAIMGQIDVRTVFDGRLSTSDAVMGEIPFQTRKKHYSIRVAIRVVTSGHSIDLNIVEQPTVSN